MELSFDGMGGKSAKTKMKVRAWLLDHVLIFQVECEYLHEQSVNKPIAEHSALTVKTVREKVLPAKT